MRFIVFWLGLALSVLTQCHDSKAFSLEEKQIEKGQLLELSPEDLKTQIKGWVTDYIGLPRDLKFDEFKVSGNRLAALHVSYRITF